MSDTAKAAENYYKMTMRDSTLQLMLFKCKDCGMYSGVWVKDKKKAEEMEIGCVCLLCDRIMEYLK